MFHFEDALNLLNISDMLIWHVTCVTPELGECQVCSVGDNLGRAFPGSFAKPSAIRHRPHALRENRMGSGFQLAAGWSMRQCVRAQENTHGRALASQHESYLACSWIKSMSCSIRNRSWMACSMNFCVERLHYVFPLSLWMLEDWRPHAGPKLKMSWSWWWLELC